MPQRIEPMQISVKEASNFAESKVFVLSVSLSISPMPVSKDPAMFPSHITKVFVPCFAVLSFLKMAPRLSVKIFSSNTPTVSRPTPKNAADASGDSPPKISEAAHPSAIAMPARKAEINV